jgi:hypothetical protein
MRRIALLGATLALMVSTAGAQQVYEPPRGSPERRALMDAIRPLAESLFYPPVEFVISDLRVSGNVAFASVVAQRPGGGAIDVQSSPGWRDGYFFPDSDPTAGQALLQRSGNGWVMSFGLFGATDVWWQSPETCATFYAVIGNVC